MKGLALPFYGVGLILLMMAALGSFETATDRQALFYGAGANFLIGGLFNVNELRKDGKQ